MWQRILSGVGWCLAAPAAIWWAFVVVVRLLWAARAVVVALMPGVLLIGCTDQARDMVIASGLPSGHDLRIALPLAVWALVSWYWARVTLRYTFVNPPLIAPTPAQRSWWQFWTLQIP